MQLEKLMEDYINLQNTIIKSDRFTFICILLYSLTADETERRMTVK